eukprot:11026286-Lingulodinium_polyedra.AAC.1
MCSTTQSCVVRIQLGAPCRLLGAPYRCHWASCEKMQWSHPAVLHCQVLWQAAGAPCSTAIAVTEGWSQQHGSPC